VVTGGGSGIGAVLAEKLSVDEKADVFVWDVNVEGMNVVKARVQERGGAIAAFPVDVSNFDQVSEIVALMESKGKEIDVIVNNAGVAICKSFLDCSNAEVQTCCALLSFFDAKQKKKGSKDI
jgi:NAD(P)-dependent dehydrogenase (short-subunit alcohol dehydrogenase family)